MKKTLALFALVAALCAAAPARAEIQTRGSQEFPGRFQVTFNPIGTQMSFTPRAPSGYKLMADFSGLVAPVFFGGIWLGGALNYTAGIFNCYYNDCGGDLQINAFVMLTLERLVKIPLVPFVRFGLGGDILVYTTNAGAFTFRAGGGVHYYLLRWLGLGVESNLNFGPGFASSTNFFYGAWDFGIGARFAF